MSLFFKAIHEALLLMCHVLICICGCAVGFISLVLFSRIMHFYCPIVYRGLIHISNIADGRINLVSDTFEVGEQVKVMLVKCPVPDKLAFRYAAALIF